MKKVAIKMFTQHKKKIRIVVGLAMFVVVFLISWNFLQQPLTDEQFTLCEQVALDVSKNLPNDVSSFSFFQTITDDFSVHVIIDKSSVEVSSQAFYHRHDRVVVNLENDNFIPERKNGIVSAAVVSVVFGIVLSVIVILIVNKLYDTIEYSTNHH